MKINLMFKDDDLTFQSVLGLSTVKGKDTKVVNKVGNAQYDVESEYFLIYDKDNRDELYVDKDFDNAFEQILKKDNEIDLKEIGKHIEGTERIFLNNDFEPVYSYKLYKQQIKNGKVVKEKKVDEIKESNINKPNEPLIIDPNVKRWKDYKTIIEKYFIKRKYFIVQTDSMHFNSLFELAKRLSSERKMARVYAPEKNPIRLRKGGRGYSLAFLEGRVKEKEEKYALILHLIDREFTFPKKYLENKVKTS